MLRVTVELIPGGTGTPRVLDRLHIVNFQQLPANRARYLAGYESEPDEAVRIDNFNRDDGFWALIGRVVKAHAPRSTDRAAGKGGEG